MAAAALALQEWNADYHEAMGASARVLVAVARGTHIVTIWPKLGKVNKGLDRLISLLDRFEARESTVLLSADGAEIPAAIRQLFKSICDMLQTARQKNVSDNWLLKASLRDIERKNQIIIGFADRFDEAVRMLHSRVAEREVPAYRASIDAYRECALTPDQAHDDDVKTGSLLHF